MPADSVELFPNTVGNGDVEVKVKFDGRWIYIDVTTLNDSDGETKELTELINKGGGVGKGMWVDQKRDADRFIRKALDKSRQFIPSKPNVLLISFFGTRPLFVHSDWGKSVGDIVPNIGLFLEFNRKELMNVTGENCDSKCFLTQKEISALEKLFKNKEFKPLVY